MNSRLNRSGVELAITLFVAVGLGLAMLKLGSIDAKFQIAALLGLSGLVVISILPARRTVCLVLWVMILPLSIEKILASTTPIWPTFIGQPISLNAADVILLLLTIFLAIDGLFSKTQAFIWPKSANYLSLLLLWAFVSYLIHVGFYGDDFVQSTPMGLLHLLRNLIMVVIISSAIKTRADVIWVLIAILITLFLQSILVYLSYSTGKLYNFSILLGQSVEAQKYTGSSGQIVRAAGTLGVANQQASFHAFYTILLIGFFAVKNHFFKNAALLVILMSCLAMIMTFSRTSWIASIIASIILFWLFLKHKEISTYGWLIGISAAVVGVIALAIMAGPIQDRLTKGDDGATDSRVRMVALAVDLFKHNPVIGVGANEYVEAGLDLYPPGYKTTEWTAIGSKPIVPPLGRIELATYITKGEKPIIVPLSVHNKYLLTLAELGLVGLMLWLGLYWQLLKEAWQCTKSVDQFYRYLGIAGVGCIVSTTTYMMLDLFSDDKTVQILLFTPIFVSAVGRLARLEKIQIEEAALEKSVV